MHNAPGAYNSKHAPGAMCIQIIPLVHVFLTRNILPDY